MGLSTSPDKESGFKTTDLTALTDYERMVIQDNATHIYQRVDFNYLGEDIEVYVDQDEDSPNKVKRVVAVLNLETGQPVQYLEDEVVAEVESRLRSGEY